MNISVLKLIDSLRAESRCRMGVGAIIVDNNNSVQSVGYNMTPRELKTCSERGGCVMVDNHCVNTTHAEIIAISNNTTDNVGCTMYVSHRPCPNCQREIIRAGIKKVVYVHDYEHGHDFLSEANIGLVKLSEDELSEFTVIIDNSLKLVQSIIHSNSIRTTMDYIDNCNNPVITKAIGHILTTRLRYVGHCKLYPGYFKPGININIIISEAVRLCIIENDGNGYYKLCDTTKLLVIDGMYIIDIEAGDRNKCKLRRVITNINKSFFINSKDERVSPLYDSCGLFEYGSTWVSDETGEYHINEKCEPMYNERYTSVSCFNSSGRALVNDINKCTFVLDSSDYVERVNKTELLLSDGDDYV